MICIACLPLLIHAPSFPISHDTQEYSATDLTYQSNTAFLNGTETYYTNSGETASGTVVVYSEPNFFLNYTMYYAGSVGTSSSVVESSEMPLGTYQYYGYSGVGMGLSGSSFETTPNMAIAFNAGLGLVTYGTTSSEDYNVGTVYAILIMVNTTSGAQIQTSWQYSFNYYWSDSGYSGVIISPYWYPIAQAGTYNFYLYVGATPYANYNYSYPSFAETVSNSGFLQDETDVSYPTNPADVAFEDGWTYNGLTFSGTPYSATSTSFSISFPTGTKATEIDFSSPFAGELDITTPNGDVVSGTGVSGAMNFSTYLPELGDFENIMGTPDVEQFNVEWNSQNVIVQHSQNTNETATGLVTETGNWFNATGADGYSFTLTPESGALNGAFYDGLQWSTVWSFDVNHLIDMGYGYPVNYFYVNNSLISSPSLYNSVSSLVRDSTKSPAVYVLYSTENLVNAPPSSNNISAKDIYLKQTEMISFNISTTEPIMNESAFVTVNWGDGDNYSTKISDQSIFNVNHSYTETGPFAPYFYVTNVPYGANASLRSQLYHLPTIIVVSLTFNVTESITEANPLQPIQFNLSIPLENYSSSDVISVEFGDGSQYLLHNMTNTSFSHAYESLGTYKPVSKLYEGGSLVSSTALQSIDILPISLRAWSVTVDHHENLTLTYSSFSLITNISLLINGSDSEDYAPQNLNGTVYNNYSFDVASSVIQSATWILKTSYNFTQSISVNFTTASSPTINSFYASVNPAMVGKSVDFSYNISWNGEVGNSTLYVNDVKINSTSYTFTEVGSYYLTLTVTSDHGSAQSSFIESVDNLPEIVSLYSSTPNALAHQTVTFYVSVNWSGDIGNSTWTVNGNKVGSDKNVLNYSFDAVGSFYVNVSVYNSFGTSEASIEENVTSGAPIILSANCTPNPANVNESVSFVANVNWNGGGTGEIVWQIDGQNITGKTYSFSESGTYEVKVIAENSYGTTGTSFNITVVSQHHQKPNPSYSSNQLIFIVLAIAVVVLASSLIFVLLKKRR